MTVAPYLIPKEWYWEQRTAITSVTLALSRLRNGFPLQFYLHVLNLYGMTAKPTG